jgi:hypothetical protein
LTEKKGIRLLCTVPKRTLCGEYGCERYFLLSRSQSQSGDGVVGRRGMRWVVRWVRRRERRGRGVSEGDGGGEVMGVGGGEMMAEGKGGEWVVGISVVLKSQTWVWPAGWRSM